MSASRYRQIKPFVAPVIVAVFGSLMAVSCASTIEMGEKASTGPEVKILFWTDPAQPRAKQNVKLNARISGLSAAQMDNATVDFAYYVFADYQAEGAASDVAAQRTNSAEYVASTRFDAATDWKVAVRVRRRGVEPVVAYFPVTVKP